MTLIMEMLIYTIVLSILVLICIGIVGNDIKNILKDI
jgi:hypothetical protein